MFMEKRFNQWLILGCVVLFLFACNDNDSDDDNNPILLKNPKTATSVVIQKNSNDQTELVWLGQSDANSYIITISTSEDFLPDDISVITLDNPSYSIDQLISGKTYYVKVVALWDDSESSESIVFTFSVPPESPSALIVTIDANTSNVTLEWQGNADTYNVYWSLSSDISIDNSLGSALGINETSFTQSLESLGVEKNDNIYYLVTAVNNGIESLIVEGSQSNVEIEKPVVINQPPVIDSPTSFSIVENSTDITTLQASDPEAMQLTYMIAGGSDSEKFIINSSTGKLMFVTAPNFDTPDDINSDNVYQLDIEVSDSVKTTSVSLQITVLEMMLTNLPPVINSPPNFNVVENNTDIATVRATDPEGKPINYQISGGGDAKLFSLDNSTGSLSFITGPIFDAPADVNADNVYLLEITVSDAEVTTTQLIQIMVSKTIVINQPPVISSSSMFNIVENAINIGDVAATDPELKPLSYSIIGGDDAGFFNLESKTGSLNFKNSPDYEMPLDENADNIYLLNIEVSDAEETVIQNLQITVLNSNIISKFNIENITVDEAVNTAELTITLNPPNTEEILITFKTDAGSAIAPEDYQNINDSILFVPGETTKTISVSIVDDDLFEESEQFFVILSSASLDTIAVNDSASITITNNDAEFHSGTLDLSRYVAIGDSVTAGFADNALYLSAQENSFPAILAKQFSEIGGGEFTQPLVADNQGGLLINGNISTIYTNRLVYDQSTEQPEILIGTPTTEVLGTAGGTQYNNMGVPNAKSYHLTSTNYGLPALLNAGFSNPYFVRFATSSNTSIMADVIAQQPSFFSLWIGNVDLLFYGLRGGEGDDQTGNDNLLTYKFADITDPTVFSEIYNGLVDSLMGSNSSIKGILIGIPDINSIPNFTTIPYNPIPLDQPTVATLNSAYEIYNDALDLAFAFKQISSEEVAKRKIRFFVGDNNPVVILDENLTDLSGSDARFINLRQATADDLIVLEAAQKIGKRADENNPASVWGVGIPLEDRDVLIPSEILAITTARLAFNSAIKEAADANNNLIYFDVASLLDELVTGIDYNGGNINATYITGGAFSLDGINLTARGHAILSNRIIDAMNSGFDANIPKVDPELYTTIFFKE